MTRSRFILRDLRPPRVRDLEEFLREQRRGLRTTDGWSFERRGAVITITAPSLLALREWLGLHCDPAEVDALMERVRPF